MAQTEGLTLRICGLEPMDGSILCCGLGFGFGEHRATISESVCATVWLCWSPNEVDWNWKEVSVLKRHASLADFGVWFLRVGWCTTKRLISRISVLRGACWKSF